MPGTVAKARLCPVLQARPSPARSLCRAFWAALASTRIASWNAVGLFVTRHQPGLARRKIAALHETVARADIVAVQGAQGNMGDLETL